MFDKVPKKLSRCIQRLLTLGITYSGTVFNLMFCCWCDPDKLYSHSGSNGRNRGVNRIVVIVTFLSITAVS